MNTTRTSLGRPLSVLLSLVTLLGALGGCAQAARPAAVAAQPEPAALCPVAGLASEPPVERVAVWAPATDVGEGALDGPLDGPPRADETVAQVERGCPAEGARVLLIGDSLSVGLGPVMARLARDCGTSFHHHGVVGAHVTQWAQDSWLRPQLERAQPNLVVVSLGGNDFQRNDPEVVEAAIERLVGKVRDHGAKLLWISPPTMPFEDAIDARLMWRQALGGEVGHDWFPTDTLDIPRVRDRVHPTLAGYRDLGRQLWSWIATEA